MNLKYTCILLLFVSASLHGQIISSVRTVSDSVYIGEPLQIYYEAKLSDNRLLNNLDFKSFENIFSLNSALEQDSSSFKADLEIENLDEYNISTKSFVRDGQGNYVFKDSFQIRIWDTGVFELPHPDIATADSTVSVNYLQSPLVLVKYPENIINPDTSSIILPIEDIIVEEKNFKDYLWILYIILGLALLVLSMFLYKKLKKKKTDEPEEMIEVVVLPAHLRALDKLQHLGKEEPWKHDKVKQYQSDLSYIVREYLEARFKVPALESTTGEITRSLRQTDINTALIPDFIDILRIADMVKFAKAKPTEDIHKSFLDKAIELIQATKENMSEEEEQQIRLSYENYLEKLKKKSMP